MDFSFTEDQEALRGLARKIFDDHCTHERLKAVEATPEWFHRTVWAELAKSNVLGVALPEDVGGSGLGFFELGILLEEVGRAVVPIPAWATLALGALPINEFGSSAQRKRWLPGVSSGDTILTAALVENGCDLPGTVTATARRDGATWRLDGVKTCVPAAHLAAAVLVPAKTGDKTVGIFVVDPNGSGVRLARQVTTNGEPQYELTLSGAAVAGDDVLGEPTGGAKILDWTLQRALAGLCAMGIGVSDRALRMTAEYTTNRKQFTKPLATFQAVAQRAADAFIWVEGMRWTTWQAVWRLSEGQSAAEDLAVAKYWAGEGGHFTTYAAQHMHGGIGLDVDYPLHRYYVWAKQIEMSLGSATQHLADLGARMAESPALAV
jgi:alkylation response protein AidB-like acyl-CoA dehydrogenase